MERLFGIPMSGVAIATVAAVALCIAALAAVGLRNPVFARLGLRNLRRGGTRTILIVAGLMLGTTIISSALTTGDTMSHTVRASVTHSLGETDELVSVRGAEIPEGADFEHATRRSYFDQALAPRAERELRRTGLVDGVTPALIEPVATQNERSRRSEPQVTLFAADPAGLEAFGQIEASGGPVSLAELRPGELYLNADAAEELEARRGDRITVLAAGLPASLTVAEIVEYDGTGTDKSAVMMPLDRAQDLLGRHSQVPHLLVSNSGDDPVGSSDRVAELAGPGLSALGLDIDTVKKDGLEFADEQGDVFMSVFTTFGTFSIAAGILLIFLIFVMLAAERHSELGIARAVGTQRRHLVQMYLFEGVGYGLGAAAVGTLLGVVVAFGMVGVIANAFEGLGLDIERQVQARSMLVAFSLGTLLTFAVVSISAWRVSRLNIVAAVRNLPEPRQRHGRKRLAMPILAALAGLLIAIEGLSAAQAAPLLLGASIVVIAAVGLARTAGVGDRLAYSTGGLALLAIWLVPFDLISEIAGKEMSMGFETWILSGLILVAGATWLIIYNTDILLRSGSALLGRIRGVAPTAKMAMAYPLRGRFRTGVTLGMFTLVVFTVVVGATTSRAFLRAVDDVEAFGGGFDIRAEVAPSSPIETPTRAIAQSPEADLADFKTAARGSFVPARARQGKAGGFEDYPLRGFDDQFLRNTSYEFATTAQGYDAPDDVWRAMANDPGLAVVDQFVVPRRQNWNFGTIPDFQLKGLYFEDQSFDPVPIEIRDPETGKTTKLTVIGVLSDTVPYEMAGIWASQASASATFGERAVPTQHYFQVADGIDADEAAANLERAFLVNGLSAESTEQVLHDTLGASYTMNWLLLGFMGLGLIVGVVALGVISARSVVERRQQIGVLRSIGFRPGMVRLSFLLESSFIALTAIGVGTILGLWVAYNVVTDAADQGSWADLSFAVPVVPLAIVFASVFAAALLATLASALKASRVYPAEALRYE